MIITVSRGGGGLDSMQSLLRSVIYLKDEKYNCIQLNSDSWMLGKFRFKIERKAFVDMGVGVGGGSKCIAFGFEKAIMLYPDFEITYLSSFVVIWGLGNSIVKTNPDHRNAPSWYPIQSHTINSNVMWPCRKCWIVLTDQG